MIQAKHFVDEALSRGFNLWSGVPCSYLKPFINYVIDDPQVRYVPAANEGDAVAIASGNQLTGNRGVAIFQNSGLGNAVNPLTSLNHTFRIPVLLIVTLRGEPGGPADAPQHGLMGPITTAMLDTMKIEWEYFPTDHSEIAPALERAIGYMDETHLPFAFVMKKGSVEPYELQSSAPRQAMPESTARAHSGPQPHVRRRDMLEAARSCCGESDLLLGSTGYTGRELYALGHQANQFYMIGSMGCLSSLGLGIALARPELRVIVMDGDGAVLMRMGALATNGYMKPDNLVHVVLDNSRHESTGGQSTVSPAVDLCSIAEACGYENIYEINDPAELEEILSRSEHAGLTFVRARILPGYPKDLPRPKEEPDELAAQFSDFIKKGAEQ